MRCSNGWMAKASQVAVAQVVAKMMMAAAMLKSNKNPSDEEIETEMWNICRCGTYPRIRAAVKTAAKEMNQ